MELRNPDSVRIYSENKSEIFNNTDTVCSGDVSLEIRKSGDNLTVSVSADTTPLRYIRMYWRFDKTEKRTEAVRVYGDEWERGYGAMAWRPVEAERCMPWVCAVSNGSDLSEDTNGRRTECFGVKVRPAAMCFWQYSAAGITLWLDIRCGGSGVILSGRKVKLCEIVFSGYRDITAFEALKKYYLTLCDDPIFPRNKVYGANNWYYAYGKSSENDIMKDTRLLCGLCSGLDNAPYMVIDDCWELNNCDAPWDVLREGFSDMKRLAGEIRKAGARPGIWFRPLADGRHVSGLDKPQHRLSRHPSYLDPSNPDVLEYAAATVRRLSAEWGYELIKHDFSTFDIFGFRGFERSSALAEDGWSFYDRSKTSAEIILELYRTIKAAAEDTTLILGCNTIGHLAAGLAHINRTGDDTSGKEWERVRKYGVNTLAFRMLHHGAFYEADADCAALTSELDGSLAAEWLRALSVSGTPLFVSAAPELVKGETAGKLKAAYARASLQKDTLIPLDWMENTCPEVWLLNGEGIRFCWYPETGAESFNP